MISSKSDSIHIFNDFIHVYSPGARAENPLGTNFRCQQKAPITSTICCKFQTNLFEFWFYTHFSFFFHTYIAPGQEQTTLCGQNPDVNRKALSLCPFVASFKTRGPYATMLTWVNSYKSLIQHFRLSVVMATNQNEEFVQLLYAWWRTTQQTFIKSSVKIPAVR